MQNATAQPQQEIYMAALAELEKLQREIEFERVENNRRKRQKLRQQTLIVGGVLLGSLMSAVSVQAMLPVAPRPLSLPEATALNNLVDYVAIRQAANDHWVTQALCAHFSVQAIDELESDDYNAAVFYLLKLAKN